MNYFAFAFSSLLMVLSFSAFAFLNQTCFAEFRDRDGKEIDIVFDFSDQMNASQMVEMKVYIDEVFSQEFSQKSGITLRRIDARRLSITSSGLIDVRIFPEEYRHPVTSELQLPMNGWIRWVSPITVGFESVVPVTCPLN